ncbi:hypothetical protein LWC34_12375 [Kibdelosporangium philippinense]|uniref:Uncharacterized protein n=1 Tax=Kibdelosporangium philippinense TaxID=211113 RepID=A0ABS8Z6V3_9PSEU|nr:hypothetical protein [Kibdelosporangium philippinense]MCE7003616.1 hypothetical protein [Kibdelosporangium philippinense]
MTEILPDDWQSPGTYWFWHRVPTPDEIRDQITDMRQAGYRSFQIQTRMAFPREEYLGPEYLSAYRAAVDEAARQGMLVGIYDEYKWLSGHAGGRTVAGRDELRERHLFWTTASVVDGRARCMVDDIRPTDVEALLEQGMSWVFEDGRVAWDEWEIVAAVDHHGAAVTARFAEVSPSGCVLEVSAAEPDTTVTVFVAARCASSRMINYLLPEAAQRFIEVGYEPYRAALGEHFGTTVRYAFFDQPHACFFRWRQHHGHVGSSLMWSAELAARFSDLPQVLLALVTDVGVATAKSRCEFFETYSAQAIEALFGTVGQWCRAHGIEFTGHEVFGSVGSWDFTDTVITADPRTNFGNDHFAIDRFRDRTAVDASNAQPQMAAKLGDSVARAHGRSRCIVEQYFSSDANGSHFAAGRWELTLRELRAAAIRHHLLGARQLVMHAYW